MDHQTVRTLQDELRRDLIPLATVPVAVAGFLIALVAPDDPPPSLFTLGLMLMVIAIVVLWLRERSPDGAAWTLVLGSLAITLMAWLWLTSASGGFLFLIPVIMAAMMLGSVSTMLVGAIATMLLLGCASQVGLSRTDVNVVTAVGAQWVAVYLLVISQRSQRTMVAWAWNGYAEARRHLEAARDRQMELKQALEDLGLARAQAVRLNDLLLSARRAVEEARQAKEDFVAKVSHELRTPLNMIIGFSDMILASPQVYSRRLPATLLADIASIRRNSQHLASLVDDVLGLAEADSGRMHLFQEMVALGEVVAEAVESVQLFFDKKGLYLDVSVPDDLPAVFCDRVRVRQVLINLLSNAARFTEAGGACVIARVEGGDLLLSVSDTGAGMEPESVRRIFEPFQQGDDSIRRRYGGTGLGLTISKRLVEMHGGKIWIESRVGEGTTVHFSLPMHRPATDDPTHRWFSPYQAYEARTRSAALGDDAVMPQILVIDEGKGLSHLVERYCERFEVVPLSKRADLRAALSDCVPSAVVVGAGAGSSAVEHDDTGSAERAIFAEAPETPVDVPVLIVGAPRTASARTRGVQDYLVKPIQYDALVQSIDAAAPGAQIILLAEDDAEARQLFTRMLNAADRGWVIHYAANGEDALRIMRDEHPDLVLLDLVMPIVDGYRVLSAKEGDEDIREIPVIVISATDPQREPRVLDAVTITRRGGLHYQEFAEVLEAVICALQPRTGAGAPPGIARE